MDVDIVVVTSFLIADVARVSAFSVTTLTIVDISGIDTTKSDSSPWLTLSPSKEESAREMLLIIELTASFAASVILVEKLVISVSFVMIQ